jgi:ABC-type antimicrobial peptide transport system ATPase subunit
VKTKITGLETKKTKRTRVKESWKVKADKVKAKRIDLERLETKRENKKEIKR